MKFYNLASYWSKINGYDYYEYKMVKEIKQINDSEYEAIVKGSKDNLYTVIINPNHPRKSSCTCLHANGRRLICKHMIAAYLSINKNLYEELKKIREEEERLRELAEKASRERFERKLKEVEDYVNSLSFKEAKEKLISYMMMEYTQYDEDDEYDYYDDEDYY